MTSTADIPGCAATWLLMAGLVLAGGLLGASRAQGAEPAIAERDGWVADTRAVLPKMAATPVIDGSIGPEEWAGAAVFDAQVSQMGGHKLYPRPVAWYIAWDAANIYIASRTPLLDNERPKRAARSRVGSAVMMDDSVELWLDPMGRNAGPQNLHNGQRKI